MGVFARLRSHHFSQRPSLFPKMRSHMNRTRCAAVITLLALMLGAARPVQAAPPPKGLILWNTLGSEREVLWTARES
jgi:hypothetical protein